jgi:hypothetical protein
MSVLLDVRIEAESSRVDVDFTTHGGEGRLLPSHGLPSRNQITPTRPDEYGQVPATQQRSLQSFNLKLEDTKVKSQNPRDLPVTECTGFSGDVASRYFHFHLLPYLGTTLVSPFVTTLS